MNSKLIALAPLILISCNLFAPRPAQLLSAPRATVEQPAAISVEPVTQKAAESVRWEYETDVASMCDIGVDGDEIYQKCSIVRRGETVVGNIENILNERGAQGWELISIIQYASFQTYVYKRPK